MKKLSIKIASAALAASALPLVGGCGSQQSQQANATPERSDVEPAAVPLRPVAVPPTLQTISFNEGVFAEPPMPKFSPDDLASALEAVSGDSRGSTPAEMPSVENQRPSSEAIDSAWQGTHVTSEPRAPELKRLPALRFPEADAGQRQPTSYDYTGIESHEPVVAQPLDPQDDWASDFQLAPPANEPNPPTATRDSAWQPSDSGDTAPSVDEQPPEIEPHAPSYHPEPVTSYQPSDLSAPAIVDTSEWSQRPPARPTMPTPQPIAAPYANSLPDLAGPMPPTFQESPELVVEPLQLPLANQATDMGVVRHHAQMLIDRGTERGERGALFSAKNDFKHAIRLVAEAQDAVSGDRRHSEALARAWQALREAADFSPEGVETIDLMQVVSAHRTDCLDDEEIARITPLEAMQRYYAYAQEQLSLAGGDEPVAAEAMHRLGKTHAFIARESSKAARTHGPQALALQQAALMVYDGHDGAANELGVLLAKYGQWHDARRVLLHAISIRPTAEKWKNLSVVHQTLGESDLAMLAQREAEAAAVHARGVAADHNVQWVNPDQFVQTGTAGRTIHAAEVQPRPAARPMQDNGTAWKLPWFK